MFLDYVLKLEQIFYLHSKCLQVLGQKQQVPCGASSTYNG